MCPVRELPGPSMAQSMQPGDDDDDDDCDDDDDDEGGDGIDDFNTLWNLK